MAGWRGAFFVLAVVPAVYVFFAIQYSAITVPFWDHTELIRWIAAWHDGTFEVSSLWAPHNHTRPLVYRAVMLFNAVLTGWDIRSEYVFLYAAIYGAFACHLWALHRLTRPADGRLVFPLALLVVSLLVFSPAGHNNHWWSMMFQLNIANLLIVLGLFVVFLNPRRWGSHLLAAASCWLAAYSLTNGLIAILAVIATLQLAAHNLFRPDRWVVFWIVNFVVLAMLYLPGMDASAGSAHPSIGKLIQFSLAYLGAPLGSIIWFPFRSQFDLPTSTLVNTVWGMVAVASAAWLCWHARARLRAGHPAALILVGFTLFAGASAVVTGWGRAAFDAYGVANANASRYTLFGVYLLLGQVYYVTAGLAEGWLRLTLPGTGGSRWPRATVVFGLSLFIILSFVTYVRAVRIYADAHKMNRLLGSAYQWGLEPTDLDQFIHPNPAFVTQLKAELQRLQIGPYRTPGLGSEKLAVGDYRRPFPLRGNVKLTQRFRVNKPGLKALSVTMVTWGNRQAGYKVDWRLYDVSDNRRREVAKGVFDSREASDWQPLRLNLPYLSDSRGRVYELELSAQGVSGARRIVGLPLYSMADQAHAGLEPVVATGESGSERLTLALRLEYAR